MIARAGALFAPSPTHSAAPTAPFVSHAPPQQVELVNLLMLTTQRVTVVGDDRQSIYGFRGASSKVFQLFRDAYGHPGLVALLTSNYRSRPVILQARACVHLLARRAIRCGRRAAAVSGQLRFQGRGKLPVRLPQSHPIHPHPPNTDATPLFQFQ